MLEAAQVQAGYGKKVVVCGASVEVGVNEVVALIGPNGAGKSTLLGAIFGLVELFGGRIRFMSTCTNRFTPAQNLHLGIAFVGQGRRVFGHLSVRENLEIGALANDRNAVKGRVEEVLECLPQLRERQSSRAGTLCGGEQQLVGIARALVSRPKLLLLDEPSAGLSAEWTRRIFEVLLELRAQDGLSLLIVEQKVRDVLGIADRAYALKLGAVAFCGPAADLRNDVQHLKEIFV